MKNSTKNSGDKKFTIIEKENYQLNLAETNLIGNTLNDNSANAIEDGYQNANFNRETDAINISNISSDISTTDEKSTFSKDIKDLGLHDIEIKQSEN